MNAPRKSLEDFDLKTSENENYFCKLIFFKEKKLDVRWHIALPEMTEMTGFVGFCGINTWSEIDTSNRQRLEQLMRHEQSELCDRCAEEFLIAQPALQALGYLSP